MYEISQSKNSQFIFASSGALFLDITGTGLDITGIVYQNWTSFECVIIIMQHSNLVQAQIIIHVAVNKLYKYNFQLLLNRKVILLSTLGAACSRVVSIKYWPVGVRVVSIKYWPGGELRSCLSPLPLRSRLTVRADAR